MSLEENKAVTRRYLLEVFDQGNLDVIDETLAADVVYHDGLSAVPLEGREHARAFAAELREAFPDLRFRIDDLFAEGDRVVARWTAAGTHRGTMLGVPATGAHVTFTGIDIVRLADGWIAEGWAEESNLSLLQQLGVDLPRS